MVAHVMDQNAYYINMKDVAASPTMVLLFAINIPSGTPLPGVGTLTPDKAQSFTPLSSDVSLKSPPQFNYSVKMPAPMTGLIKASMSQSTTWPVDNPKQPLFFTFLVFQNAGVQYSGASNMTNLYFSTTEIPYFSFYYYYAMDMDMDIARLVIEKIQTS